MKNEAKPSMVYIYGGLLLYIIIVAIISIVFVIFKSIWLNNVDYGQHMFKLNQQTNMRTSP